MMYELRWVVQYGGEPDAGAINTAGMGMQPQWQTLQTRKVLEDGFPMGDWKNVRVVYDPD
jgi:hypothetical protein